MHVCVHLRMCLCVRASVCVYLEGLLLEVSDGVAGHQVL